MHRMPELPLRLSVRRYLRRSDQRRVLKCDLCDGDPTCVKVCPCGAISYEEISKEAYTKLLANADKIPSLVREAIGKQE
jgi:Fe-S-cluster-containing hydrogenase component 2